MSETKVSSVTISKAYRLAYAMADASISQLGQAATNIFLKEMESKHAIKIALNNKSNYEARGLSIAADIMENSNENIAILFTEWTKLFGETPTPTTIATNILAWNQYEPDSFIKKIKF